MVFYIIMNYYFQGIFFSLIIIGHLIFEKYFNVFVVLSLGSIYLIISIVIRVSNGRAYVINVIVGIININHFVIKESRNLSINDVIWKVIIY